MKNLKILCSIFAAALIFGCTSPATNNSDMNTTPIEKSDLTDSSAQNLVNAGDSLSTRLADMEGMYKDIGLTPDQIDKFEDDYKRKVEALKTHGRGTYDKQSIEATKDQSMRTVTSNEEYQRYLDWKKNNPVQY